MYTVLDLCLLCFLLLTWIFLIICRDVFTNNDQGCLYGSGATVWFSQCHWTEPAEQWLIDRYPITKDTLCIIDGIYNHYYDVIMGTIASQITSLTFVHLTIYSDADQSKHQSSASLAFVRRIHRGPVNSPHKWPVRRKMFPLDDVIMIKVNPANTHIERNTTAAWRSDV